MLVNLLVVCTFIVMIINIVRTLILLMSREVKPRDK